MSKSTAQTVDQMNQFLAARDWDTLRHYLAENVVYHIPGRSSLSGTYRGADEVLSYLARWSGQMERMPVATTVLQTSSDRQRVVTISQRTALVDGQWLQWIEKQAFFFHDQQVAAVWLFADKTEDFDAYCSAPAAGTAGDGYRNYLTGGVASPFPARA